VPFSWATTEMPLDLLMKNVQDPADDFLYYLRLTAGKEADRELARPLFSELDELSAALTCLRHGNLQLDTIWVGGGRNVTAMHFDDCARFHGVIRGEKQFIMFPPDYSHLRNLDTLPMRSPAGWYSGLGVGPLDPAVHPKLKKTTPYRALVAPGEMLYMPSCWWHLVSIPDRFTISTSVIFRPPSIYFRWYFWRKRFCERYAGQARLVRELEAAGVRRPAHVPRPRAS